MGDSIKNWHEWICHSNFSFLIGAAHPEELVQRAVDLGYSSLTLSDFDGVYGIVRAYRKLKALRKEGLGHNFKLHYGAEIHLQKDHKKPLWLQDSLVFCCQNLKGYYNLCRLITKSRKKTKLGACMPLDELLEHDLEGLVAVQPMRGLIRLGPKGKEQLFERSLRLKQCLGIRFYFALSRHLSAAEDQWIKDALSIADRLKIPLLLSQDAFFDRPEKKDLCDLLQAVRLNQRVDQIPEHLFVNSRRCLHSIEELNRIYGSFPRLRNALQNSQSLADGITFCLSDLCYNYPKEMIPEGYSPQEYLNRLVRDGARTHYDQKVPAKVEQQLKHELSLVEHLGFADYFLTVWDIVSWAKAKGILCQGRGSAANSAICFVLGITAINPANFDLLFERFISVERGDPPDIDVDFENIRREEVIAYIYERYGRDRAAMVCNLVTFRKKGALRFSAKALGIPEKLADKVSKSLETLASRGVKTSEILTNLRRDLDGEQIIPEHYWELWGDMAERLRGYPRYLGIHSGGFMLSDKPINWLVPIEPATMEGRSVIQWAKEDIEALGFFKIDILALGMLTAVRKCFEMIERHQGRKITLAKIPEDDPATYEMICRADTIGVFQIESAAQRASLPTLQPENFYDLVIQVAIIRPGPILGGVKHPYLRRRKGLEPVTYPDLRLEPILKRTYGTIIFQEQLMRVAMTVGGFTGGEADEIRKNIGSFSAKGDITKWTTQLIQGMIREGIDPLFIQEVVKQIQGFASYGFPESHAASFALLAYATSWLKRHYPAAFFAGLLNSQPMGFYQPDTLIKTALHEGVPVLPLSVNRSGYEADLEKAKPQEGRTRFGIRLGFNLLSELSREGADMLLAQRRIGGPYRSLEDFCRRNRMNRRDLAALASANAFADLDEKRRPSLWLAELPPEPPKSPPAPAITFWESEPAHEKQIDFLDETELESVKEDYDALGTSLGRHLSAIIKEQAWVYSLPVGLIVQTARLKELPPNRSYAVFGMILAKQSPGTARKMLFVTLEDESGTVQVVINPKTYACYGPLIESQRFLCLMGRLQKIEGALSLMAFQIFSPIVSSKAKILTFEQRRVFEQAQSVDKKKVRSYI